MSSLDLHSCWRLPPDYKYRTSFRFSLTISITTFLTFWVTLRQSLFIDIAVRKLHDVQYHVLTKSLGNSTPEIPSASEEDAETEINSFINLPIDTLTPHVHRKPRRTLKNATPCISYSVPYIYDFYKHPWARKTFYPFATARAYYHIPVEPDDIPKTVLITAYGRCKFVRLPFGLKKTVQIL